MRGKGSPAGTATARAVIGMIIVPKPDAPPPPTVVNIIEYYNVALDHYFITAISQEITALDFGVYPGWVRTGQAFRAYAPGSTGRTGRQPVCRAYGNPAAGLRFAFYSANPGGCFATLAGFPRLVAARGERSVRDGRARHHDGHVPGRRRADLSRVEQPA